MNSSRNTGRLTHVDEVTTPLLTQLERVHTQLQDIDYRKLLHNQLVHQTSVSKKDCVNCYLLSTEEARLHQQQRHLEEKLTFYNHLRLQRNANIP